ncbi:unnamed protein product [Meloidogyne enterolobii]|uniref:Uncharacterized protein n=1 Tax=Meloidogyne enterolobii TaxID=390850 RepID=A0ACB0Z0Z3_MELEN
MYLKLILNTFFLLILINISIGIKCKCPENGKEKLRHSRVKRGCFCECLGFGKSQNNSGKSSEDEIEEGSAGHHETGQVEGSSIGTSHSFQQEETSYGGATDGIGYGTRSYGWKEILGGSKYFGESQGEDSSIKVASYSYDERVPKNIVKNKEGTHGGKNSMGGRYRTSKGSEIEKVNGKKKALFICENHFFSLAQLHVN